MQTNWPNFAPKWLHPTEISMINGVRLWSYKKVDPLAIQNNLVLYGRGV
jgi:hypothetical protein